MQEDTAIHLTPVRTFVTRTLALLPLSAFAALALLLLSGCEVTDYQALLDKRAKKELAKQDEQMNQSGEPSGLITQVPAATSPVGVNSPVSTINQRALATELEQLLSLIHI